MSRNATTVISHDDLQVVAEALKLRLPLRGPESRRVARLRTLLAATADLTGALTAHHHTAQVHCHGNFGAGDLDLATERLGNALATFGALVGEVASEYRALTAPAAVPA